MLSFIVPAHNEEAMLGRTLRAIGEVTATIGEEIDVIVVDDGSTDRTAEIARACGARVVPVHHRQIAAARNAGGRVAQGRVLFFVDADTLITASLVMAACRAIEGGAAGGGATVRFDAPVPLYGRVMQWLAVPLYRLGKIASGSFLFCTREAFARTGGFDESLFASEEAAMSQALKRCGRFVVLRESVITSGRKLRQYSRGEILDAIGQVIKSRGRITSRENARVWYEGRREDIPPMD